VGEWLGPVDWGYDFARHDWAADRGGVNPEVSADGALALRAMCNDPDADWRICPSGMVAFRVVIIGMYDGWPHWRPTPAVGYVGPMGSTEVAHFYRLTLSHGCGHVFRAEAGR